MDAFQQYLQTLGSNVIVRKTVRGGVTQYITVNSQLYFCMYLNNTDMAVSNHTHVYIDVNQSDKVQKYTLTVLYLISRRLLFLRRSLQRTFIASGFPSSLSVILHARERNIIQSTLV